MRIIILILCCVCGNYGENGTTVSVQERSTILVTFNVSIIKEEARCKSSKKELILEEGKTVKLKGLSINIPKRENNSHQRKPTTEIKKVKCTYMNGSGQYELGEEYNLQEKNVPWEEEHTITKDMYGVWSCKLKYNEDGVLGGIKPIEQDDVNGAVRYSYVICNITVKKPGLSTTPVQTDTLNTNLWYIIGGVGILVLLIIIGQTIALCYFRRKAQPRRRMDNMTARSRSDRGDRARYSAPPCKKGKSSARENADTDSHIYEMVGINALYNKSSDLSPGADTDTAEKNIRHRPPLPLPHESSDLSPGADTDTAEKNIRHRPPLPLPHEIPKPVPTKTLPRDKPFPIKSMPSTVSPNSSSNLISKKKGKELPPPPGQGTKKAPTRPPKQVDEDNIPGSLRRTAMPTTAPAVASATAKIGTLPKTSSTESPMSELKNFFKMRNIGNDTPTSSPAGTLDRKEPPKIQVKNNTQTKTQTQKQPPNVSTKPIVYQQNQIKLILPKIEASLKAPKPLVPKAIESTASPIKSPPPPKKPSQVVSQKQKPVSQKPVTQPIPKSVKKRPLPTPEPARKLPPEPISPYPVPSLPSIYQAADEDLTPGTDDEEWTYEHLEQYNLYNI